jgi:hypothetical protein
MSFILVDTSNKKHDLQLNAWHWRTILMLLDVSETVSKERLETMGISGACPTLSRAEASSIAAALRNKVLSGLGSDERIMLDGTLTKEPDHGTFFRDPQDQHKNYSTNAQVLKKLCDFCESCDGFTIY